MGKYKALHKVLEKKGGGALRQVLCREGHQFAEDCALGMRQGCACLVLKKFHQGADNGRGSAEAAEQQVWGHKTESTMHFSSQESSAVFAWILIFHCSGQATVFLPPTLPWSREHLESVTEMYNYPQLHYLKMDIKSEFPLETKACIVPWNASSMLQWTQHCARSELTSKAQKTLCSMRHFLLQSPMCFIFFFSISVKQIPQV